MKKILLFVVAVMTSAVVMAQLDGKKIYVNPGHGSWGPNDRPCATIPYPNLETTGMPDTLGFYESNTNLWKTLELGRKLEEAGAVVMHSRTQSGPWPYAYPYSDYTYEAYKALPDYTAYNKDLSVIAAESDAFEADMFISVHSNAATEGTSTNYPLLLYKGSDATAANAGSKEMCQSIWPYLFECMNSGLDPYSYYSLTKMNNRGCDDFYGYTLGVLKQSRPGLLTEGYFHTYQPARHRALNPDYCKQEGIRYYRGIAAYFGEEAETKGYIMGTVKDLHEKMSHKLYNYAAKSNDQWVPCNGAVVTLYKGSEKVAEYKVDTLYNGIFYFPDLEPGNDYTLDATCEGYKPLFAEYKEAITVEANKTTYPMIFLESETYEPPKEVFVDYPDKATAGAVAPSKIEMQEVGDTTYAIEGTIKRTIQRGDSIIILSHTEEGTAHLYLINTKDNTIANIPTEGIDPVDTENLGSYLALSDVAMSCDGVLVGCNYIRCQYDDGQVKEGFKRGNLQFYRWDSLHVAPTKWVSTQHSSNFYQGNMGMSLAIKGEIEDCTLLFTGVHATYLGIRFSYMAVVDNVVASTGYTGYEIDELATFYQPRTGEPYMLQLSPRGEKADYVFDAPLTLPTEFELNYDVKQENIVLGALATDSVNLTANASYFRYAGHSFMVTPYYNADTLVAGVRMYDVTEGFDNAKLVKTTNTDLETPVKSVYAAATANVTTKGFVVNLITDGTVTTFSSVGVEQPVVANIYAYALNVTKADNAYTFTFKANENAISGDIIFYQEGVEVGRQVLTDVVKGENTVVINEVDLPGAEKVATTWAVELRGENVTKWAKLYTETAVSTYSRVFNTVDNSTESDYFGRIYAVNRAGGLGTAANGLHVYSPEYVLENTTPYYSGQFGNPTRPDVDEFGTLYIADWSDSHSGIYLVDPANVSGGFTPFFEGTANGDGLISNNGVEVASGSPSVCIWGKGKDTQMFMYSEDAGTTLKANSVLMYHIGNEDGTLKSSWGEAPTKQYALQQTNGAGNIQCTSHGFFCSQYRTSGQNNSGVPALIFVDYEGNILFNSGKAPYVDIIDGSDRSAYAVSDDESRLIMQNASGQFLVFDITWAEDHTPTLTLNYIYDHGITKQYAICQMNFDYAGNIVASGASGFHIFTVPTDNNVTTTPAKKSLVVGKGDWTTVNVEDTELSAVVYSNNGTIFVEAEAGSMIEVYTVLGQRLFAAEATTNLTAIGNIPANIVLVKVNNQVVKVALR